MSELRRECEIWMGNIKDMGHIPEQELINTFWPDKIRPLTANPVFQLENGKLHITCKPASYNNLFCLGNGPP